MPSSIPGIKQPPSGIFRLLGSGQSVTEASPGLHDPATSGYRLRFAWKDLCVGTTYDKPNFSPIINSAAVANANGKRIGVGLGLLAGAPADLVAKSNTIVTGAGTVPKPWDPFFQAAADNFTKQEAIALDGIPNLVYATIGGLGVVMESRMEVDDLGTDLPLWIASSKHRIDNFNANFHQTPFLMTWARAQHDAAGESASNEVADYGLSTYRKRFGLMDCMWKATSSPGFAPNARIRDNAGTNPGGLQQLTGNDVGQEGPLADQIAMALLCNVWFLEIYLSYFIPANVALLVATIPKLRSKYLSVSVPPASATTPTGVA